MRALVTGASRGIGRAIALNLAAQGAQLCLVARHATDDRELSAACLAAGAPVVELFDADLRTADACNAAVARAMDALGGLDVLVHAAGHVEDALVCSMTDEQWQNVRQIHLDAAFYLARAVSKPMIKQHSGRIIFLSSVVASEPNRGQANYVAAKGAIESLTRALATELGSRQITVNAIAPGIIETAMTAPMRALHSDLLLKHIALRRFGTPEDIAGVVGFLVSPAASYITGQVLHVDGGL